MLKKIIAWAVGVGIVTVVVIAIAAACGAFSNDGSDSTKSVKCPSGYNCTLDQATGSNNQTQGVPVPVGNPQLGCNGKNVGAVQALIGLNVVCLGTEYDAYTWRSVPLVVDATCPLGFICTLHLADDRIVVTFTPAKYQIKAGTFRRVAGYPASDAVYTPCALLAKEQAFGASQTPSFPVSSLGFTCNNGQAVQSQAAPSSAAPAPYVAPAAVVQVPAPAPAPYVPPAPASSCPTSSAQASGLLGGNGWNLMPKTDGTGWKYGPSAAPAIIVAPSFGRVDYANGSLRNGQSAAGITEATFWCLG